MSKNWRIVDATVKLTAEELTNITVEHLGVVEALAQRFDHNYLSLTKRADEYRELLVEMDDHLTRAEELLALLGETDTHEDKLREEAEEE